MFKKYLVVIFLTLSVTLMTVATFYYPGGSQADKTSIGFSWRNNYISNLFAEQAVNGAKNGARVWAITGMLFLSAGFALFFVEFSKKLPTSRASKIVKYVGASGMIFTFLIATPLHDTMITISSTMFLIGLFYITFFVYKSKLTLFKLVCTVGLLIFYSTILVYGIQQLHAILPIMQKITFVSTILIVLALNYFTSAKDFISTATVRTKR